MSGRRAFASNRGVCTPQLKPDGGQESRILSPFNTPIKKKKLFPFLLNRPTNTKILSILNCSSH